jgi:hypothetical protein
MIRSNSIDEAKVAGMEEIDNCFPDIDVSCLLFEDRETQAVK